MACLLLITIKGHLTFAFWVLPITNGVYVDLSDSNVATFSIPRCDMSVIVARGGEPMNDDKPISAPVAATARGVTTGVKAPFKVAKSTFKKELQM